MIRYMTCNFLYQTFCIIRSRWSISAFCTRSRVSCLQIDGLVAVVMSYQQPIQSSCDPIAEFVLPELGDGSVFMIPESCPYAQDNYIPAAWLRSAF